MSDGQTEMLESREGPMPPPTAGPVRDAFSRIADAAEQIAAAVQEDRPHALAIFEDIHVIADWVRKLLAQQATSADVRSRFPVVHLFKPEGDSK